MLDEDESVFAAMRAGARGYVVKGAETDDLLRALESVGRGDVVFGPAVAGRVLSYLSRPLSARDPVLPNSKSTIAPRQ
jgi:DNA-binding NarL/FixJ family response regulator